MGRCYGGCVSIGAGFGFNRNVDVSDRPALSNAEKFIQRVAVVYNLDRAASGQIADYVCTQYNIPAGNKIGLHMGTGWQWAYTPERYAESIVPLAAHFDAIHASSMVLCEGSPNRMNFPRVVDPDDITSYGWDTAYVLASARRMVDRGYGEEPRLTGYSPMGSHPMFPGYPVANGPWTLDTGDYEYADMLWAGMARGKVIIPPDYVRDPVDFGYPQLEEYTDYVVTGYHPTFEAFRGDWTGLGTAEDGVPRWVASFIADRRRYRAGFTMLPYGRIGLPKLTQDDTYDPDLYAKSVAIIDRGVAFERTLEQAQDTLRLLFPFAYVGLKFGPYPVAKQALCYRVAADAGMTQTAYWYDDASDTRTWDQIAIGMADPNSGLSWTTAQLNAGTADPHTFDIAIGGGLKNGTSSSYDNARIAAWCSTTNGFVPAATGAVVMGGASYGYQWMHRLASLDRLVAAYVNPWVAGGGYHHGMYQAEVVTSVFLAMLDNRCSLLEASIIGYENCYYPLGNPLVRFFA